MQQLSHLNQQRHSLQKGGQFNQEVIIIIIISQEWRQDSTGTVGSILNKEKLIPIQTENDAHFISIRLHAVILSIVMQQQKIRK